MERSQKVLKRFEIVFHVCFWVGGILFFYFTGYGKPIQYGVFQGENHTLMLPVIIGALFGIGLFYGNSSWLFAKYFKRETWQWYIVYITLFHLLIIVVELGVDYWLIRYYFSTKTITQETIGLDMLLLEVIGNTILLTGSMAYGAIKSWIRNERLKRQLLEDKLKTELAFLRTQINPHFLFNCLNNLYSLALREKIQETADGIAKLSMLMRYTLHDSNTEKVKLNKELNYIEDYLALQHLRIADEDDIFIKFDVKGETAHKEVAPMLLIPFIENAFKHGLSLKAKTLIKIFLEIVDNQLIFKVCNTINHSKKSLEVASGLGLTNVKRRLELLYPQKHQLHIQQSPQEYTVALTINL